MAKLMMVLTLSCFLFFSGFSSGYVLLEDPISQKGVLEAFESLILEGKESWNIPGMAVGIIYQGTPIYQKAFGIKDMETEDPIDIETLFQIGSTTKAFTAALMATFVDEGTFNWNDSVRDHYPEFSFRDPFAREHFLLEDLFAQHSGLYPYAGDEIAFWCYPRETILDSLAYLPSLYSFRSGFSYVNNLFVVAEEIMIRHSGATYKQLLNERFFEPLGMSHSKATVEGFLESDNHTSTHRHSPDGPIKIDPDAGFLNWLTPVFPAGGIASNIPDMLRWVEMQMNLGRFGETQVISSENIKKMHTPKAIMLGNAIDPIRAYCLSWVFEEYAGQKLIWHNGDTSACRAMVQMDLNHQLGIVILSNVGGQSLPDLLARSFIKLALGIEPENVRMPVGSELMDDSFLFYPSLPMEVYTGAYDNPLFGTVILSTDGSNLIGVASEALHPFLFKHRTRDLFDIYLPAFSTDQSLLQAHFILSPAGIADQFFLYSAGNPEGYRFVRNSE